MLTAAKEVEHEKKRQHSEDDVVMPLKRCMRKLSGFDFWKMALGQPKFVLAPMVDQSELAWRMLGRRHGAQLCYTPMINCRIFEVNSSYRKEVWEIHEGDRPLIAQVCGDDVGCILRVAKQLEHSCDGIDLNLGCPQNIAKKGHYGAYLQDEWELISEIVGRMHAELHVPVSVKIRVFEDVGRSVEYARMLEKSGAQLITVHGRTREQKGQNTGMADWSKIKAVVEAVNVPVFANGNIMSLRDLERCVEETGAVGVMSAEGHLYNPCIFEGKTPEIAEMIQEYLELVKMHPAQMSAIRGHLFKLLRPCLMLDKYTSFRQKMGAAKTLEELERLSGEICGLLEMDEKEASVSEMESRHWLCQAYIRHPQQEPSRE